MFGLVFNIKTVSIAILVAFSLGAASGAHLMGKWYRYDLMAAQIKNLKAANKRYADAVGVSKDIDAATGEIELSNDEILAAINAKIEETARKKPEEPKNAATIEANVANADGVVCIAPDVLHEIGRLR